MDNTQKTENDCYAEEKEIAETFHSRLKKLREEKGTSKRQMSKLFGLSFQRYGSYEDKANPPFYLLIAFAKYFEVSVDYLLGLSTIETLEFNKLNRVMMDAGIDDDFVRAFRILKDHDRPEPLSYMNLLKDLALQQASDPTGFHLLRYLQIFAFNSINQNQSIGMNEEGDLILYEFDAPNLPIVIPSEELVITTLMQGIKDELIKLRSSSDELRKPSLQERMEKLQAMQRPKRTKK